jgi:hypothetical protein
MLTQERMFIRSTGMFHENIRAFKERFSGLKIN